MNFRVKNFIYSMNLVKSTQELKKILEKEKINVDVNKVLGQYTEIKKEFINSIQDIIVKEIVEDNNLEFIAKIPKEYDIEVKELFYQNKLKSFTDYLHEKNIYSIRYIKKEDIINAENIPGFGSGKMQLLNDTIDDYIGRVHKKIELENTLILNIKNYWYEKLKKEEICKIAEILNISFSNSDLKIEDIQGKSIGSFKLDNKRVLISIVEALNNLKSINEILEGLYIENNSNNIISEKEINCITLRVGEGQTLESIGHQFNITRERVRQVVKKSAKKIEKYFLNQDFPISLKLLFINRQFCYIEELLKLVDYKWHNIMKLLINSKESDVFFMYEPLSIMYFNKLENLHSIGQSLSRLPKVFKFYDYLDYIMNILREHEIYSMEIDSIEPLLVYHGYRVYGDYFSDHKITLLEAFEIIFKDYLKEPLYIDDKGYIVLQNLCKKNLNFDFESSVRAVDARIRDSENIVLVDSKTYQHVKNMKFKKSVINKIKEKLEIELNENAIVSAQGLMNKYGEIFSKYGVTNKYILYSIIIKYLDEYSTGKGNTLDISKSLEELNHTREEVLLEEINSKGKIYIDDIIKKMFWPKFKVEDTLSKSALLIKVDNYITTGEKLGLTNDLEIIIKEIAVEEVVGDGFTTSTRLYHEFNKNKKLNEFFQRNNIEKGEKITHIIKYAVKNMKGSTYFLHLEGSPFNNLDDVVFNKFKNRINIDDIRCFLNFYGFPRISTSKLVTNMISSGKYIRVSSSELVEVCNFKISDNVIRALLCYIKSKFKDKEYLSLKILDDYYEKLPKINYSWNPYLIESLLLKSGYKRIERRFYDQDSERLIMVKDNSSINKFDELVYWIIKKEYTGKMNESSIVAFLIKSGVIFCKERATDKKLPFDLYKSEKFYIDKYGRVELLEVLI